ncbi:sensor histidine kinase [Thermomonospora umbrina]|uniref:histidine kinase n=1 Tax=Thermomonospora umbrina TaxID=111806 RepID=A0A3D9SNI5_9ACTN|nr:nitrate- and nitrite sensing domain-containing protein [Thermomonospora umbrina]REE97438.1 signal transduction histidine kinase [Thermomonospora umbrina]
MPRRLRQWSLRSKITAMLVSLALLWACAAWMPTRDALNLLNVARLDDRVARPATELVTALQDERKLSLVGLADRGRAAELARLRLRSDRAVAHFRTSATGIWGTGDELRRHVDDVVRRLDTLPTGRRAIDRGLVSRSAAARPFDRVIDAAFTVVRSNASGVDEQGIARDGHALVSLRRAREVMAREDALLSGALTAGRFGTGEYAQFVGLVHTQRHLRAEMVATLPPGVRAAYDRLVRGPEFARLSALEDHVTLRSRGGTRLLVTAAQWDQATEPVLARLEEMVRAGGDEIVERAAPTAAGVLLRLALAGGLGLVALVASLVSVSTLRTLVRQLERLRTAATELATERLPRVVERIGRGEKVDISAEAPALRFGDDEIGRVGKAFNLAQETAVKAAVLQAELRAGFRQVLVSRARRTQSLVLQMLKHIDEMERREDLTETEMEALYRIDHLAARMRRYSENLIQLSGESPSRRFRRPVPMIDVVRGAMSEIEGYQRVALNTLDMTGPRLAGRAYLDVVRVLAELMENGLRFSNSDVTVGGQSVANGYAIEIVDRGLGMSEDQIAAANERLRERPAFDLVPGDQLGFFIVGMHASRHAMAVSLQRSPYGGISAVVLLPHDILVDDDVVITTDGVPAVQGVHVGDTGGNVALLTRPAGPVPARPDAAADVPQRVNGTPPEHPAESVEETPGGLPIRQPQEHLAPQLRTDPPAPADDERPLDVRSPEEIRRIVGSYQRGTRRGRADAQKNRPEDPEPSQPFEGDEGPG